MLFPTHVMAALAITFATLATATPIPHGTHDVRSYAKETNDKRDPSDFDFLAARDKAATNADVPTRISAREPSEIDARDKATTNAGSVGPVKKARLELNIRDKAATNAKPISIDKRSELETRGEAATNAVKPIKFGIVSADVSDVQVARVSQRDKAAANACRVPLDNQLLARGEAATNACVVPPPVKQPPFKTPFVDSIEIAKKRSEAAANAFPVSESIAIAKKRSEATTNACRPFIEARTVEERSIPICPKAKARSEAATNACRPPYFEARTVEERAVPICP